MKVLVVDDNKDFANALCKLLALSGYDDVRCAYRGQDGIKMARQVRPDFLLVDLGMPGMDGFAVARVLREEFHDSAPTLIAITGYGQQSDRERTRESRFDFHLTKPFGFAELQEILGLPNHLPTV
jgi:CheY-like chemotaxis protein